MTVATLLPERFEPVIGLEIHVQLATRTKLFCGCPNRFGAPPNTLTCPVCLGLPGALPVANRQAVALALRVGAALDCQIDPVTRFDRKQYFYPDLPKNYQISQHLHPICRGGSLAFDREDGSEGRVALIRAHLEEDTGKLVHGGPGEETRVDFNRAGVPLLEIVTESSIRSPEEARDFLTALRRVLVSLGVSECEMEKGSLRVDTNVSLRRALAPLGARVEVKNLNSFAGVARALRYEIDRQGALLASLAPVAVETRAFDLKTEVTRPLRAKEAAHDYRYFPEPDLPPIRIAPEEIAAARTALPELPRAKAARFRRDFALSEYDARVLTAEDVVAAFFEALAAALGEGGAKEAANWVIGEMSQIRNARQCRFEDLRVTAEGLSGLVRLVREGRLTRATARELLSKASATGEDPAALAAQADAGRIDDAGALAAAVSAAIEKTPRAVADYRAGKANALQFLVGAVMKETKGRADANTVRRLLAERLRQKA